MNKYIQLQISGSWKRFATTAKDWIAVDNLPSTVRMTINGVADVTYAPASFKEWRGTVVIPNTPADSNYGSITDFANAILSKASMQFIDHYGVTYTVAIVGPEFGWRSLVNMWDASSNNFYVPVRIVRTA